MPLKPRDDHAKPGDRMSDCGKDPSRGSRCKPRRRSLSTSSERWQEETTWAREHLNVNHGGNLHDAKALFPEAPEPWLDLSTGINPNPYPFQIQDTDAFTRLPSRQTIDNLERIAARAFGVSNVARVAAASGSQVLIGLLPRLRPKGPGRHPWTDLQRTRGMLAETGPWMRHGRTSL